MYSLLPDILWVPSSKVLIKMDPETATHLYTHMLLVKSNPVAPPVNY
jgi:hypothetical protein